MRYILNECIKAKDESERAEAIALKNAFPYLKEWGLI